MIVMRVSCSNVGLNVEYERIVWIMKYIISGNLWNVKTSEYIVLNLSELCESSILYDSFAALEFFVSAEICEMLNFRIYHNCPYK